MGMPHWFAFPSEVLEAALPAHTGRLSQTHGHPLMCEFSQLCPSELETVVGRLCHAVELVCSAAMSDNANTTVLPLGDDRVVCLADITKSSVLINPETLGTGGKLRYVDSLWCLV